MSCSSDYTPEEWRDFLALTVYVMAFKARDAQKHMAIRKIPALVKEAFAHQGFLEEGRAKYAENELVNDVVNELKTPEQQQQRIDINNDLPDLEELIGRVNEALAQKSDDTEASEFRAFVYQLAYEVCKAAGGGFLGIGENIDAKEADFLHRLKSSLLEKQ